MENFGDQYRVVYERGVSASYLILQSNINEKVTNYQLEMIARNQIKNILSLDMRYDDQNMSFYYNITSRLQLSQYLKRRKIKRDELITILAEIGNTLIDSKGFLLSENSFVINEDFMFINPASLQLSLIYLPIGIERDVTEDFKNFILRLILDIVVIDEDETDNYIHKILLCAKSDTFNIKAFVEMLNNLSWENDSENLQDSKNLQLEQAIAHCNQNSFEKAGKLRMLASIVFIQIILAMLVYFRRPYLMLSGGNSYITYASIAVVVVSINFLLLRVMLKHNSKITTAVRAIHDLGVSEDLDVDGDLNVKEDLDIIEDLDMVVDIEEKRGSDTVFLDCSEKRYPCLHGVNDGSSEFIVISKDDFLIGRLTGHVDYTLDNAAIGKIHARIVCRDDQYYIIDNNSINGTYINNTRIESNKEHKIINFDRISFANQDYTFINQIDRNSLQNPTE